MTFDKVLKRNQLIAEHLAQIALHREIVGWGGRSTRLNASYRDVLAAQERLLSAVERLLENCTACSHAGKPVKTADSAANPEVNTSATAMVVLAAAMPTGLMATH